MRNKITPINRSFSGAHLNNLRDILSLLAAVILTTKAFSKKGMQICSPIPVN